MSICSVQKLKLEEEEEEEKRRRKRRKKNHTSPYTYFSGERNAINFIFQWWRSLKSHESFIHCDVRRNVYFRGTWDVQSCEMFRHNVKCQLMNYAAIVSWVYMERLLDYDGVHINLITDSVLFSRSWQNTLIITSIVTYTCLYICCFSR